MADVIRFAADDLLKRKNELSEWRVQQKALIERFKEITHSVSESWMGNTTADLSRVAERYLRDLSQLDDFCGAYINALDQAHKAYSATEQAIVSEVRRLHE